MGTLPVNERRSVVKSTLAVQGNTASPLEGAICLNTVARLVAAVVRIGPTGLAAGKLFREDDTPRRITKEHVAQDVDA